MKQKSSKALAKDFEKGLNHRDPLIAIGFYQVAIRDILLERKEIIYSPLNKSPYSLSALAERNPQFFYEAAKKFFTISAGELSEQQFGERIFAKSDDFARAILTFSYCLIVKAKPWKICEGVFSDLQFSFLLCKMLEISTAAPEYELIWQELMTISLEKPSYSLSGLPVNVEEYLSRDLTPSFFFWAVEHLDKLPDDILKQVWKARSFTSQDVTERLLSLIDRHQKKLKLETLVHWMKKLQEEKVPLEILLILWRRVAQFAKGNDSNFHTLLIELELTVKNRIGEANEEEWILLMEIVEVVSQSTQGLAAGFAIRTLEKLIKLSAGGDDNCYCPWLITNSKVTTPSYMEQIHIRIVKLAQSYFEVCCREYVLLIPLLIQMEISGLGNKDENLNLFCCLCEKLEQDLSANVFPKAVELLRSLEHCSYNPEASSGRLLEALVKVLASAESQKLLAYYSYQLGCFCRDKGLALTSLSKKVMAELNEDDQLKKLLENLSK